MAEENIRQIVECSICKNAFTDPRQLPCIHTFCCECLKRTSETAKKKPGDKMPCPLCKREFTIPHEGIVGLQKNFFVEDLMVNLLEFKTEIQSNDPILNIGSAAEEKIKRLANAKYCMKHTQKLLDCYCAECKKIVCVSCVDENHKSHNCTDLTTVDDEFRLMIDKYAWRISNYADEMLSLKKHEGSRKAELFKKVANNEAAIMKRNEELKDMIDRHTQSLLDELSLMKSRHLKEIENKVEEIDMHCKTLRNFESYCTALKMKGTASEICGSVDQITARAEALERDHEALIGRPHKSVEILFRATNFEDVLQNANGNLLGNVGETTSQYENFAIVVGLDDAMAITEDIVKINLHQPNKVIIQGELPATMVPEAVAAVYFNTMYVAGIGDNFDDIWKYNFVSGWLKCASLVQGRRRHSAAFIDEILYICGGFADSTNSVLDSVEAYNSVTNKCSTIGKLVHCVQNAGNCVPFKGSLYIFGGADKDYNAFNHVQVYNTKDNTCSVLSRPMPQPYMLMRVALSDTFAILFGRHTCYMFNFETENWVERKQFQTDVNHFGLVLANGRLFVIGGGSDEKEKDGNTIWKCRDDVRFVPLQNILDDKPIEWRIHGKLPKPSLVYASAMMRLLA